MRLGRIEKLDGRHEGFEPSAEIGRDRGFADLVRRRVEGHVDDGERALGDERVLRFAVGENPKRIAQAAGADLFDAEANRQGLLEAGGTVVFAGDFEAGPARVGRAGGGVNPESEGTEKCMSPARSVSANSTMRWWRK